VNVTVIGVRHHSPACARVVRDVVVTRRPRFVLVEGPCDMNERMNELVLPHRLPIALFTWRQDTEAGTSRGTWSPFCEYSPEWIAIKSALEIGATPLFIDLPAWHDAFEGEDNRYSDRHIRASDALPRICARLGFEGIDALWDHLFEVPTDAVGLVCGAHETPSRRSVSLAAALETYFAELRADEPASERDEPREAHMANWIAWASKKAAGEPVVVVCGGWHKAALERLWKNATVDPNGDPPVVAEPPGARIGSYFVPFSFKRLDSFSGYASGMPSPAFYQAVWDSGAERGPESMLHAAVRHLRAKAQRVSVADAIAARTLADGLRLLRGHTALARIDVLDGLAGALVKDALEAPLPWTRRGVLGARTDPMLVELVAAFSGDRVGDLAPGTPRPPLATDAFAELERVGLTVDRTERRVRVDLTSERGLAQSRVLHRLRVLAIPGFERTRGPSLTRQTTSLDEHWSIVRKLETDAALVEAALHGATLEGAAASKLEERTKGATDLPTLAEVLIEAALAGIGALAARWLGAIEAQIEREASFSALGAALERLLALFRGEAVLAARETADLARVLGACFERGLWLFESVQGANAPLDSGHIVAIRALRDATRSGLHVDAARAEAVCERRARDVEAPASVRGAALGFSWSVFAASSGQSVESRAVAILKSVARADLIGDFLSGLFALAREEVMRTPPLLEAIDVAVSGFTSTDFFVALPSLRGAFAYFPPRERLAIAESLVGAAEGGVDPMELLGGTVDPALVTRGHTLEVRAEERASRFGLGDDHEGRTT
jgi:hypothetical protein